MIEHRHTYSSPRVSSASSVCTSHFPQPSAPSSDSSATLGHTTPSLVGSPDRACWSSSCDRAPSQSTTRLDEEAEEEEEEDALPEACAVLDEEEEEEWLSRLPLEEDEDDEKEGVGAWWRGFTGTRTRGPFTGSQNRPLATVNSRGTAATTGAGEDAGAGEGAGAEDALAAAGGEGAEGGTSRKRRDERGDDGSEDRGRGSGSEGGGRAREEEEEEAAAAVGCVSVGCGCVCMDGRGPNSASSAKEFHWNHSCQWVKVVTHRKPCSQPPVAWRTKYPLRGSSMSKRSAT